MWYDNVVEYVCQVCGIYFPDIDTSQIIYCPKCGSTECVRVG